MRIAIVDDLKSDADFLEKQIKDILSEYSYYLKIIKYESADEFMISWANFDAAFMDILMPDITGIHAAKKLRNVGCDIPIIFITTEREFALEGYEVQAFDYIIKPINTERLKTVIKRIIKNINMERSITVKANRRTVKIPLNSIIFAEVRGHKTEIHTTNGKYSTYMSFKDFTEALKKETGFKICNRGLIINFENMKRLNKNSFITVDDVENQISRSKINEVQKEYYDYVFRKTRGEQI